LRSMLIHGWVPTLTDLIPSGAAIVRKGRRLDKDRTYHATITKGVIDLTGNTLAAPFTWQFKT